jgi:hypothetical protein
MAAIETNSSIGMAFTYFGTYVVGDLAVAAVLVVIIALAFLLAFRVSLPLAVACVFPLVLVLVLVNSSPIVIGMLGIFIFISAVFVAKNFMFN